MARAGQGRSRPKRSPLVAFLVPALGCLCAPRPLLSAPRSLRSPARPASASRYLLDPRLFNTRRVRRSLLPAANVHASARALAYLLGSLVGGECTPRSAPLSVRQWQGQDEEREWLRMKGDSNAGAQSSNANEIEEALGFGLYTFRERPEGAGRARSVQRAFGARGLGGTIVLCDVAYGCVIAVTSNQLTAASVVTDDIVGTICEKLGLGSLQVM